MNEQPVIKWNSNTKYVDIETGEAITKYQFGRNNYIIIKTEKHVTFNTNKTIGYIEYTKQCRRNPQGKLFTDNA